MSLVRTSWSNFSKPMLAMLALPETVRVPRLACVRRAAPFVTAALVTTLAVAAPITAAAQDKAPRTTKPAAGKGGSNGTKGGSKKGDNGDAPKVDEAKTEPVVEATPAAPPVTAAEADSTTAAPLTEPPREEWDPTDVAEVPGKTYLFIGARYRGNIVPKFVLNLFVDEGKTIYSNSVGVELDVRKDGFSIIPALTYTEYGTGDILFKQKNTPDIAGNYSAINSSMKALYGQVDLLWSTKISKTLDFEYGAGFGLGVVFGDLQNNWVQEDPNGSLAASNGKRYSPCAAVGNPGTGCNAADHKNSDINKVGGYTEPSWFSGGSKPVLFPWISIPQIGLRFKPVKQFVARLGIGFSLTGFWFGLSGGYGLEKKPMP